MCYDDLQTFLTWLSGTWSFTCHAEVYPTTQIQMQLYKKNVFLRTLFLGRNF